MLTHPARRQVLFAIGALTFLYFSYYNLVSKHKKVGDSLLDKNKQGRFKWSRFYGFLWSVAVHLILQTLPYVVWTHWKDGKTQAEIGLMVAVVFTVLTLSYSIREVNMHLSNCKLASALYLSLMPAVQATAASLVAVAIDWMAA